MPGWEEIVAFGTQIKDVGATARIVQDFRLDDPLAGSVAVRRLELGRVTMSTVRSTGHRMVAHEPDKVTYFSPLAGQLRLKKDGSIYNADFGGGLYVRPGRRTSHIIAPASGTFYGVAVTARVRSAAPTGTSPATEYQDVNQSSAASCLHGFLQYFIREFSRSRSLLEKPALMASAETLIMACLEELNAEVAPGEGPSLVVMARRVDRAERIMRERLSEQLSVEELAEDTGISPRSLQTAFKTVRGSTPTQALRQLRLNHARELLMSADETPRVTDVALSCGISHFGRFAEAYKRRFGESPSETALRTSPEAEVLVAGNNRRRRS